MLPFLKTLWRGWKQALLGLNSGISWTLMTLVYVLAVSPVALWFQITGKKLLDRGPGDPEADSEWSPPPLGRQDVRRAQRPW